VTYVQEPSRGRSHARNRGIQVSVAPIVAFTDADCVVSRSWLRELVEAFDEETVSAVAGEILPDPPRTPGQQYMAMRKRYWQRAALTSPWPYAVTANVALRRDVFARIGAFDPRFATGEDQDISWRFFEAGLTLRYASAAVVFHRHRAGPWDFFKQQLGWAHGSCRLHSRYELSHWLARGEQTGLLELTTTCLRASGRRLTRGGPEMDFYYPLFDLIRGLAWRLAGIYATFMDLPVAFRPRPRVRLDVQHWRIRHDESAGAAAPAALAPPTERAG
jgi:GT2 family glycosyltransferase